MGKAHLSAADLCPEVAIAAICDPALTEASRPLLSFAEILESPLIEGVVIAAPTARHAMLVEQALAAGRHVLCEKPLTLDPVRDRALGALAARRGLILQIGFWRRFASPYRRLAELLASGLVGAPAAIRAAQWDAAPPPAAFCDPGVSGGIEIDCGVHEFDLARWLTSAAVEAVTSLAAPPSEALAAVGDVDTIQGLARLVNGVVVSIDLTRRAGFRDSIRTELIGTEGSIVVEFAESGMLTVRWADRQELVAFPENIIAEALARQLAGFAGAIRSGAPCPDAATAEDASEALRAAMALRTSRMRWCPPAAGD